MKQTLQTLLLIALLALSVSAQSSTLSSLPSTSTAPPSSPSAASKPGQDDAVLKKLEQALDRLTLAEAKNDLLKEQLQAKDDRISAKDAEIDLLKEQKKELLSATKDRRDAGSIDAERLADAKVIIAKQDAEISSLRNPGFLSSLFDKRTLYGAVGGYGLCKATSSASARNFFSTGQTSPTINLPQSQFLYFQTESEALRASIKSLQKSLQGSH